MLADTLYAKATIDLKTQNSVFLWLGANVMMEYPYDEAETLLQANLKNSKSHLTSVIEDLDFLKDQLTISEVNVARVHNYRVQLRKVLRDKEK